MLKLTITRYSYVIQYLVNVICTFVRAILQKKGLLLRGIDRNKFIKKGYYYLISCNNQDWRRGNMFNIFKKIGWFIRRNKLLFFVVVVADALAGAISVIMPKIIGQTIDLIATSQLSLTNFTQTVGILILLIIIGYIMAATWVYVLFRLGIDFERVFRNKFYRHIMTMGGTFFKKNAVGDLMVRATTDLKQVSLVTSDGFFFLLEGTIYLSMILIGMLTSGNITLTLLAVVPIACAEFTSASFGTKISQFHKVAQEKLCTLSESLLESVRGVQAIRAYNQEEQNYQMLEGRTSAVEKEFGRADFYENLNIFLLYLAYGIAEILVIYFGAQMVFKSQVTPGNFVTFMMYINMIGWPLFAIGAVFGLLKRGEASYDRIQEILDVETDIKIDTTKATIDHFTSLQLKDFSFAYPDAGPEEYALKDISFDLSKGKTLGIVGKVGGGRSTLVKQLLGEYPVQKPETLEVNGQPFDYYNIASIRQLFGYVPQEHVLFSKSVRENLLVADVDATEAQLDQAIDLADFRKDLAFLQNGMDTMTGESGTMLSGGQKQRLAIARAFLSNPEILVLDDALSAVDGKTEEKIIANIIGHRKNRTNIIIAHRLSAVAHADEILVLDGGKIVERGTHTELIAQDGWYCEQVAYQSLEGITNEENE